jgi:hypothetical protein
MDFQCAAGTYLQSFNPIDPQPSTTFPFGSKVLLNANNALVAVFKTTHQPKEVPVLQIYRTESQYNPLVVVSEGYGPRSVADGAVPLLAVGFSFMRSVSSATTEYVFQVSVASAPNNNNNNVPANITTTTFVHPMSVALNAARKTLSLGDQVVASGTWSYNNGSVFFVLWMDGTISRADVSTVPATFIPDWSPCLPTFPPPPPLWTVIHTAAAAYAPSVRHQCIAVPVHPTSVLAPGRQIQLICMITFVQNEVFGTYLVRVLGNGNRMPVDMARHTAPYASSSLFYDVSFNAVYLSTYRIASFSGPKHILKARLNAGYNFRCKKSFIVFLFILLFVFSHVFNCRSEVTSTPSSFTPAVQLGSALAPSNWIMPPPPAVGLNNNYPSYPAGMSLDFAAVEPLSNVLLFYVPTLTAANTYLHLLYYIPVDVTSQGGIGERNMQPVLLESEENSIYAGKLLSSISTVYTVLNGPDVIFTLYAGMYVRYGWISGAFHPMGSCVQCPAERTSMPGARSLYECYCAVSFFGE